MTRVRFGPFEADVPAGRLTRGGGGVALQDLPFRLLVALLERPGQLVTRAELTERLWGADTFVDSTAGLNTAVAKLREALDDDPERPAFIETIPKRGYRFVGTAAPIDAPAGAVARRPVSLFVAWAAAALAVMAIVPVAVFSLRAGPPRISVAVALFDNETGRAELSRLAQGLTDATVFGLTANPRLNVIGNAAVLRTARPFRDLAAIRDAVHADFIVIGQVQMVDDTTIVRAHLIRAADEVHVWVHVSNLTEGGEAALQSAVAAQIADAVSTHALAAR
ncbi:MAG: winged helix-turn-helix domain-containing protein [Vicinamibacterales bacterium]